MSDIYSCPFCNGEAEIQHGQFVIDPSTKYENVYVQCKSCGARGPKAYIDSGSIVIAAWNQRIDSIKLKSVLKLLRGAVKMNAYESDDEYVKNFWNDVLRRTDEILGE